MLGGGEKLGEKKAVSKSKQTPRALRFEATVAMEGVVLSYPTLGEILNHIEMDGEAPQEAFEEAFESGSRKNLVRTNTEEGPWQQLPQVQDQRRGLRDSHGRGVQDRGVAFHEEEDLYEMLESDACMRCAQTACFCCGSMRAKKSLGCLASWISHMTIVPATNLTILSLNHQLYLDFVFHRTFAARIGHNLCMPLIFFFFYAWLAQWMPTSVVPPPDAVFDASMLYNGAFGCFVIVQIWWIIWGLISNHQLMGFLVLIPNFLLYLGGSIYFMLLRDTSANATWLWSTTSSWTSPFLLYWLLSLIQSFSHAFDADIPPRMMGEVSWMSLAGTLRRAKESPISFIRVPQFYIASLTQTLFGAVDELCATFRLFPIYALKAAYSYGYKNDYYSVMRLIADFTIGELELRITNWYFRFKMLINLLFFANQITLFREISEITLITKRFFFSHGRSSARLHWHWWQ